MKKRTTLLAVASVVVLPMLFGGCVQQDKYDSLLSSNRSLKEQLTRTEDERDSANANVEALRSQLTRTRDSLNEMQARNSSLSGEIGGLSGELDDMMRQIAGLQLGPLPEDVTGRFAALAAAYPNVLSFDAKRGMLRFSSDFSFDLGSTDLKADAQATLQEVARILNSETGRDFEARVVGHTDNVRIAQPQTLAKHPTNVHLSVHRAISVRDFLVSSGVSPIRMQVAGYGEFRPIVDNPAKGGAAANRRVEIFLTPMPSLDYTTTPTQTAVTNAETIEEPMK